MAAFTQRKGRESDGDPRNQFAEGIAALLEVIPQQEPTMLPDDALAAGYVSTAAMAEGLSYTYSRAKDVLRKAFRDGRAERVKVGQSYWYRAAGTGGKG